MSLFAKHQSRLDIAIDRAHDEIDAHAIGTPERKAANEELVKLMEAQVLETKTHISKDTLFVGTMYVGLTLIVVGIDLFGHSTTFTKVMTNLAFRPKLV